jgi:hypothetical protein
MFITFLAAVILPFFPHLFLGQLDAGVPPVVAPLTENTDPLALANIVLEAVSAKNYWLLAGAGISLAVAVLRAVAAKFPKLEAFIEQPVVTYALPIVLSFALGLASLALAGPVTQAGLVALAFTSLKVAFTAIAGYVGIKKVAEQQAQAKVAAAAAVPDVKAAVQELNKP